MSFQLGTFSPVQEELGAKRQQMRQAAGCFNQHVSDVISQLMLHQKELAAIQSQSESPRFAAGSVYFLLAHAAWFNLVPKYFFTQPKLTVL